MSIIVEIINNNMPFLVDSITACINSLGFSIHLLTHPVLLVKRDKKGVICKYYISDRGWTDFEETLRLVCHHEIDNARPVFPKKGKPYIRTKRDKKILNNLSVKGKV